MVAMVTSYVVVVALNVMCSVSRVVVNEMLFIALYQEP